MVIDSLPPDLGSAPSPAPFVEIIDLLERMVDVDWFAPGEADLRDYLILVEQIQRRMSHVQARIIAAADAQNAWADDGARSMNTWLRSLTGSSRVAASQAMKLSRALRSDLPETSRALASGDLSREHALILQREATRTDRLLDQLKDPEHGERFLLGIASRLDADDFRKALKHWAGMADPEAADRNWREEDENEEIFLNAAGDMYYISGRLNKVSGRALETALNAQMGRKAEGDGRSLGQRRAAALTQWAQSWLDSGALTPGARIRPHLSVHVPFETLQALCEATGSAIPPPASFTPAASVFHTLRSPGGPRAADCGDDRPVRNGIDTPESERFDAQEWFAKWQQGDDHVIATAIDYEKLRGLPPATLDDGSSLAPAALARIACGSNLTRIVFGAESTIIDVGREERIFPANQTRAIIARDKHCQYPSCTEPPEFGEIHHSLWWWKHKGRTSTDQGILLCWHHHGFVHQRDISIARVDGAWVFSDDQGRIIEPAGNGKPQTFRP